MHNLTYIFCIFSGLIIAITMHHHAISYNAEVARIYSSHRLYSALVVDVLLLGLEKAHFRAYSYNVKRKS